LKVHANKAGYRELKVLLRIKEHSQPSCVIELLDHFEHVGPNGRHLCLVLELMWTDVSNFMKGQYRWPEIRMTASKEVTRQVLKGAEKLAQIGIIHNGLTFFLIYSHYRFASSEPSLILWE
jgi:serine/threonine-protein kinase SRPK3